MNKFKLEYTNIYTLRVGSRIIIAKSKKEAETYFASKLSNDNLLDAIEEVYEWII